MPDDTHRRGPGRPPGAKNKPPKPACERKPMGRPRAWRQPATEPLETLVPVSVWHAWRDPAYKRQIEALAEAHQKEDPNKTT